MSWTGKRFIYAGGIAEALAVCVITLIVVSGRVLHVDILQSFLPGMIGMKLVTATAFLLAAMALIANASKSRQAHFVSAVLASVALVLGLLSLVEEITGRDLLIDRIWMAESPGAVETVHPGRMASNTAVCFVSLGVALLLSRRRTRVPSVIARLSLLLVGIIAVQVLIGYVFEAQQVRSSAASTPMALPTAINFVLLAFGASRQRREEWPMSVLSADTAAGTAARSLLPAGVLITVGAGWLRLRGQELGWYGTATGTALYALVSVMALSAVTLFAASRLHRIELARREDQEDLRRALAAQDVIGAAPREVEAVERAIVDQSRTLVDAAGAAVATLDRGHVCYRTGSGTASVLEGVREKAERSFVGLSLLENLHAIFDDLSRENAVDEQVRERMGSVSVAVVPLRTGEIVLGSIVVFAERGRIMTAQQLDLLRVIANASAAALAQARQFEAKKALLLEQAGELAVMQEQFTAFMRNIPAAAFIKDERGRYVFGNRPLSRFLGREVRDILGAADEELLDPAQVKLLQEKESEALASGRTASQIIRFDAAREGSSWLLLRFPIGIEGGRQFLGGVAVDITEQKRAEEQIAQLNASLELRVAARTEQLQRINAELEAFTYSVSHDLRAPLRAVSGYSRIVEEDFSTSLDDEAKRYLRTIRAEAQRMGNLIDDLLAFSRTGRQSISPTEVDVARLVREVFQEIRHHHPDRVLELVSGDLPIARADRSLIRQVVVNLLSNAAKYAKKEGTIRMEVGATPDEDFNTYWIRDFGVGFDMRYADKLFGVFQRLHSNEEFEGTGVGLAIVERIVRRHGGRVWAEGAVGEGACFYFTLPNVDSEIFSEMESPEMDAEIVSPVDESREN